MDSYVLVKGEEDWTLQFDDSPVESPPFSVACHIQISYSQNENYNWFLWSKKPTIWPKKVSFLFRKKSEILFSRFYYLLLTFNGIQLLCEVEIYSN